MHSDEGTLIAVREYNEETGESKYYITFSYFLQIFQTKVLQLQYIRYIWSRSCQGSNEILDNTNQSERS